MSGIVGREEELADIRSVVQKLAAGEGGFRGYAGDPGMGKTLMLHALAEAAREAGIEVAWARPGEEIGCRADERGVDERGEGGFGERDTRGLGERGAVGLGARGAGGSGKRGAGGLGEKGAGGFGERGRRGWREVVEFGVGVKARGVPGVVVLDDLHRWGGDAVGWVERLLDLSSAGVLVAVGYRPRQMGLPMAAVLGRASVGDEVRVLGALTAEEIRRVVGGRGDAEAIHRESEGVPLYACVLADSAHAGTAQLAAELAELHADELAVAQAAAVLRGPFLPETLMTVSDLDVETTRGVVDRLVAMDILRATKSGQLLAFRHRTLAQAAYQTASLSRRTALHLRADRELERQGAPAILRAGHVANSFDPTKPERHTTLALGARQALSTDPESASGWLEAAEARLTQDHPDWPETHLLLAKARLHLGRFDDSRATFLELAEVGCGAWGGQESDVVGGEGRVAGRRAQERGESDVVGREERVAGRRAQERGESDVVGREGRVAGGGDGDGVVGRDVGVRTDAVMYTGRIERLLGRYPEAVAFVRTGLASAGTPTARAVGLVELSAIAADRADYADSDRLATEAVRIARAAGDPLLRCIALASAAWARTALGNTTTAGAAVMEAARLVDAMVDALVVQDIDVLRLLGQSELLLERLSDARRHLQRGVRLARGTGQRHVLPNLLKALTDLESRLGHLDRAMTLLDEAEPLAAETGVVAIQTLLAAMRATTLVWQRPSAQAHESIAAAERAIGYAAGADEELVWPTQAQCALGEALIFAGQPGLGSHILLTVGGGPRLPRVAAHRRVRWWELLTVAAAAEADVARADEYACLAVAAADRAPTVLRRGLAYRARALADAAKGDTSGARSAAETAATAFTGAGAQLDLGRTHLLIASICIDTSQHGPAHDHLALAAALARRCHAHRLTEQVDAQLARLPSRDWQANLTPRERDIARLAGQALASTAIAARLHLSVRTVDSHLGRIYRKLGVTNRVALANLLNAPGPAGVGRHTAG